MTEDARAKKLAEYRAEAEKLCLEQGRVAIERYVKERVLVDGLPPSEYPKQVWIYVGLDEAQERYYASDHPVRSLPVLDKGQAVIAVDDDFCLGIPRYRVKTLTGSEQIFEIEDRWLAVLFKTLDHPRPG